MTIRRDVWGEERREIEIESEQETQYNNSNYYREQANSILNC